MQWKYLVFFLFLIVSQGTPAKAETLAVSFIRLDPYLSDLRDAILESARATDSLQVDFAVADGNGQRQIDQLAAMLGRHPKAVVLFVRDAETFRQTANLAEKAGVPVVYVLMHPPGDDLRIKFSIVSSNGYVAGLLQMRKLADLMGRKGNLVLLRGIDDEKDSIDRTQGVKEVLRSFPDIHVIEEASASWDRDPASRLVAEWLAKGDRIDAVAANNDEMALGAIAALEAAGIHGVPVAGVDGIPAALSAMKSGAMALTVFQNARMQGRRAVQDALDLAEGKPVEEYDWVPYELVTSRVLSAYLSRH